MSLSARQQNSNQIAAGLKPGLQVGSIVDYRFYNAKDKAFYGQIHTARLIGISFEAPNDKTHVVYQRYLGDIALHGYEVLGATTLKLTADQIADPKLFLQRDI